jgi:hypothetical protein
MVSINNTRQCKFLMSTELGDIKARTARIGRELGERPEAAVWARRLW